MQLTKFIRPLDYQVILSNLCRMLLLFSTIMVLPLLVSMINMEFRYSMLFGSMSMAALIVGKLGRFLRKTGELAIKEALAVTALTYLIFALLGALVFTPVTPYINGVFEAMSGFTTSGLTVVDVNDLPNSLLFFRSYSQWIGGAGIVVLSLVMLLGPGKTAFQLYTSEFGEERLAGDVRATARIVLKIYLLLTGAGYLTFILLDMGLFDALIHTMSIVSTGGFSLYSDSFGHYDNPFIESAGVIFMIAGAIGFPTYSLLKQAGFRRFLGDLQLRYLVIIVIAGSILFLGSWHWQFDKLLTSVFQSTTAITGSGFFVEEARSFPSEVKLLSVVLMIFGGSAGSTVGGLKLFRVIIMLIGIPDLDSSTSAKRNQNPDKIWQFGHIRT